MKPRAFSSLFPISTTMMTSPRSFLACLVVGLLHLAVVHSSEAATDCSCAFNLSLADQPNCRVFGTLDSTDSRIGWRPASWKCLRAYNISEGKNLDLGERNPLDDLLIMCPTLKDANASVASMVALLKQDDNPVSQALRADFTEFFESTDEGATYMLKDEIEIQNGQTQDCTVTPSFCYQYMSIFLANRPHDLEHVCTQMHLRFLAKSLIEQQIVRAAICEAIKQEDPQQDDPNVVSATATDEQRAECQALYEQIVQILDEHPSQSCSGVERSLDSAPPLCQGDEATTSAATALSTTTMLLAMLLMGVYQVY